MATSFILPGERIDLPSSSKSTTLGPGIASSTSRADASTSYVATKMGVLQSTSGKGKGKSDNESFWVETSTKRYIPAVRESVLGTIIARHAEGYRVDIGSAQMVSLDALAFEGATKRSKPNLKVGTLVYARVSTASRDMEPEIECVEPSTGKSDGFGELKGGLVVNCSIQLCRQLINSKFPLLQILAGHIPFETAVGLNGRVWIKAKTVTEGIALKRILEDVDEGSLAVDRAEIGTRVRAHLA